MVAAIPRTPGREEGATGASTESEDATASRSLPIRVRLSLLLGGLFLLTGMATAAVAFVDIRRARLTDVEHRLAAASVEMATAWETSARGLETQMSELAKRPTVLAQLDSSDQRAWRELVAALGGRPGREESVGFELWDPAGRRLLTSSESLPPIAPAEAQLLIAEVADRQAGVGRLLPLGEHVSINVIATARREGGELAGYLVRRHRANRSESNSRLLGALVGADAKIYLGNARGDVWTDLAARAQLPPAATDRSAGGESTRYRRSDGERVMASLTPISGTPLVALVELPLGPQLAAARADGLRLILIVLTGTGVAISLVWLICSRLTRPLEQLSQASTAMALGTYQSRVEEGPPDEIGRLARAFNRMAESVEQARGRLEERVAERTAELAAANEELEAFSYSVSHDLRTPLRALDGFSQALLEDCEPVLDETGRSHLQRIRNASQRMSRLIDDLLVLSRVTRAPLVLEDVNLAETAEELVAQLRSGEPTRRARIDVTPDLEVRGDRTLLRSLLQNLLENAWKYTAPMAEARIELRVDRSGPEEIFFVRDNGVGFDMTYADKLFTPFQRLHGRREFAGDGVGLASVKRIVRRHGGRVWAEAEVGSGATFYFTLGTAESRDERAGP